MIELFLKSVLEQDTSPIVLCDLTSTIVYMNAAAKKRYHGDLTGKSLLACHNADSCEKIRRVLSWFSESTAHNRVYTFRSEQENKDVYMIALRDGDGNLIGYYEKHEYRTSESTPLYAMPLVTERLLLRPWQSGDAEALYRYASDPDIGYPAGWPAHTSIENSRAIIASVLSAPETYAVCTKDGEPIGSVGLKTGDATDLTDRADECELGYWLGKPYWGRGIIPEAAEALLRHAFLTLGMRAVWCGHYDGNQKSRRVMEKLGFAYQFTTESVDVPLLGETRKGHVTLLTKEAWEKRQK